MRSTMYAGEYDIYLPKHLKKLSPSSLRAVF
jgi:hypothetical protein